MSTNDLTTVVIATCGSHHENRKSRKLPVEDGLAGVLLHGQVHVEQRLQHASILDRVGEVVQALVYEGRQELVHALVDGDGGSDGVVLVAAATLALEGLFDVLVALTEGLGQGQGEALAF